MKRTEILSKDIWNDKKLNRINDLVTNHSDNQSKGEKIRRELLTVQYKLEDYIEKSDIKANEVLDILDNVKMCLKTLDITKRAP